LVSALISFCKWPVAVLVAATTPAAVLSLADLLGEAWRGGMLASPFPIGFLSMFFAMTAFHRTRFVRFWSTLEHEMTHALFAWLSFVPVYDLWTSDGSGASSGQPAVGQVRLGGDNWLISISPYFFPTAAVALLAATWLLAEVPSMTSSVLLGASTAWCVVSTWHETHRGQSDLRGVGFLFSALFLPGANALSYGILMASEVGGRARAWEYALDAPTRTMDWIRAWL
jgi:hypothetical protein